MADALQSVLSMTVNSNHAAGAETHMEELDLIVLNMDLQADEERAKSLLRKLHGVEAARIIQEGVWIRYNPAQLKKEKVLKVLQEAGFKASLFQDSLSGETGDVSQA